MDNKRLKSLEKEINTLQQQRRAILDDRFVKLKEHLIQNGPMKIEDARKTFKIDRPRTVIIYSKFRRYGIISIIDFQKTRWIAHESNAPKPKWS